MTTSYQPIEKSKRTAIVDILRGWALLGVVIGNYIDFLYIGLPVKEEHNVVSTILQLINRYFFAAKSWTLLTLLFGYGFAILINNVASKGKNPVLFFSWRMILLFVLAFINSSIWLGDILKDYAFLGLVLLLFYKSSAKVLAGICAVLLVLTPVITAYIGNLKMDYTEITTNPVYLKLYYSGNLLDFFNFNLLASFYEQIVRLGYAVTAHIVMFACMLFGFLLQKINFFNRLTELRKTLKYTLFISLFCAVTLGVIFNVALSYKAVFLNYFFPAYWVVLSTMVFIATGICLLYNSNKLKTVFSYFSACGKMTLTNYIVQNIVAAFIFSGIGLKIGNTMPYWFYFSLAIFVYVAQLFISKWWLSKFNYGPIEWAWRAASYRQLFPFRKTNDEAVTEVKAL